MNQIFVKTFIVSVSLSVSVLAASCAYRVNKSSQQSSVEEGKAKSPITFNLVESTVLAAKCVQCHSNATKNSGNLNLETYANVVAALPDIKDDIDDGKMPKSPGVLLTDEEKFLLLSWIQMGAPETAPIASPVPAQPPAPAPVVTSDPPTPGLQPTFTSINTLIFKAKCLDCHNSNGDASDAPFEQYSDIVSGTIVVPGDATKSSLIKHITAGAKKLMPPPKSRYKSIAPEDIEIITHWITSGALNN